MAAVALTGCAARAGAPVSFPGATASGDIENRTAEAVSAIVAAEPQVEPAAEEEVNPPAADPSSVTAHPSPPAVAEANPAIAQPPGDFGLTRRLDRLFSANGIGPAIWGVDVRALDGNERLYARNPDVLLTPASTMKLVTLAATAARLGWEHRFDTALLTAATVSEGTLRGDLVVRGAGDPTINAPGGADVFSVWAGELWELGIRRIAGRIIGDDDILDDGALETSGFGSGWAWDDLSRGFAAPAGALQHRENVVEVIVSPGSGAGRPAITRFRNGGSGLTLRNDVMTVRADEAAAIRLRRTPRRSSLVVSGRIPEDAAPMVRVVAVGNPTLFFAQAFKEALEAYGIPVDGEATDIDSLTSPERTAALLGSRTVVRHRSKPLAEIGIDMLKQSKNLYAESLVRHLGAAVGAAAHAGRSVVNQVLAGWDIDGRGAVVADGSGLSRYTYLTAGTLVEVLARLYRDPDHRARIMTALPVAGRDGTLRRRLVGTAAEGVVRAKTGSMSRVRALTGFVETANGEPLAFAILANNFSAPAAEVTRVIDEAVSTLAAFARRSGSVRAAHRIHSATAGSPW